MTSQPAVLESDIPARLDRLPWSRWHWLVVIALGTVWILDGLEVTIVGAVAGVLTEKGSGLELSPGQIGQAAALYVTGACLGALFFARLTDKWGRKKLFMVTLAVYLLATVATAFAPSFLWFAVCRFFTGAGIGGEYAAINSAIDELIPARVRGTVDLIINGSFWVGTALGAALSLVLLDPSVFDKDLGWRVAFGSGALLGLGILVLRRWVPESPRWLLIHGRADEAERIVSDIERQVKESTGEQLPEPGKAIKVRPRDDIGFFTLAKTIFADYRRRAVVGFALFIGQAFLYNAVFFTYALILTKMFGVDAGKVGVFLLVLAIGNFMGPLVLGRLFDTVGRRPMIAGTYILSGVLLIVTGLLFKNGTLDEWGITAAWCVVFFFASAGASSAYLTVSEVFPMETRALSIAFFYAIGTAAGGIVGPLWFGKLVEAGKHDIANGWYVASALMIVAGLVEAFLGVRAEQKSLEEIATPLSAEAAEGEERAEGAQPSRPRRRARFGPSETGAMWSPGSAVSTRRGEDPELDAEVDAIAAAVERHGEVSRRQLGDEVKCRFWGPGRYRRALRAAQERGRVARRGDRYVAGGEGVRRAGEVPETQRTTRT